MRSIEYGRASEIDSEEVKKTMDNKVKLGRYRHYKGGEYELIGVARHSETLEDMVVYKALYGRSDLWVRPLKMFVEQIDREDYSGPRFVWMG